jgi:hypothetical protein
MSKAEKKLKAMQANPQSDWCMNDLKALASRYGIDYRQPGTSHVTFSCINGMCLTVPAHKPIKAIYIKRFVELIESLNEREEPKHD